MNPTGARTDDDYLAHDFPTFATDLARKEKTTLAGKAKISPSKNAPGISAPDTLDS